MVQIYISMQSALDEIKDDGEQKTVFLLGDLTISKKLKNTTYIVQLENTVVMKTNDFITAKDTARVIAYDGYVDALHNSKVYARGKSYVCAYDRSLVIALDKSKVIAKGKSVIHARGDSQVEICNKNVYKSYGNSIVKEDVQFIERPTFLTA